MSEKTKRTGKSEKKKSGFLNEFRNKLKSSKKVRIITAVVAAVVVLFVGFCIYAASYGDIMPGVSVNGVDVGGMSIESATAKIQNQIVEPLNSRTLVLKCEDNQKTVSVQELVPGGIDAEQIARQAFEHGRSGGFLSKAFSLMGSVFGGKDIEAVVAVDEASLKAVVDELSAEYATEVKETEYSVDGNVLTITKGHGGRCVIMKKAMAAVGEAIADENVNEVVFVIEDAEPEDVDADEFYAMLTEPAKNAEYKLENGQVVITDEKYSVIVGKDEIKKALKSKEQSYSLNVETVAPEVTAEQLKGLLFRDVMGEWSSGYASSSYARASNVELAADRINGRVLMPGDVFSYDQAILPRTAENGYQSAGVYVGNRVESGIGGGICQPSSTLYGAVLYANLEIVERTSHSLPVSYVPGGQDATIAQGYIDFKFRNDTEYPVKIVATYSNRKLVCKILGVKPDGEKVEVVHSVTGSYTPKVNKTADESIPQGYKKTVSRGASGYGVASRRIVTVDGVEVKNEKLTGSVYRATDTEVLVNPADMETAPESLAEYTGEAVELEGETDEETQETSGEISGENGETEGTEPTRPDESNQGEETIRPEEQPAEAPESVTDVEVVEISVE